MIRERIKSISKSLNLRRAGALLVFVLVFGLGIIQTLFFSGPQVRAATLVAGPNSTATCFNWDNDMDGSGSFTPLTSWGSLANTQISDNSYAQASVSTFDLAWGPGLYCNNFGFNLDLATLSITNIEVDVEMRTNTNTSSPCSADWQFSVAKPDQSRSAYRPWRTNQLSTTDTTLTENHANWGETWTAADINDVDFGVNFQPDYGGDSGCGSKTFMVDHIEITVTYTINLPPAAPTLSLPASNATAVSTTPTFTMSTTDTETDYARYEIIVYQSNCSTIVRTIDQTSSQIGWSGQNTQTGTAYSNGSTATHAYQQPQLAANTTYCWKARAIDPGGRNIWGSYSGTRLFTTNVDPAAPTLSTPTPGQMVITTTPQFTFSATDTESDYLRYEIVIYQSDCSTVIRTIDQTSSQTGWSGQNTQTSTAYTSGSTATHTYQAPPLLTNTTYCWKARAIDPGGSNTWGNYSGTRLFFINIAPNTPILILPASSQTGVAINPEIRLYSIDDDNDYVRYRVYVYQSDCITPVRTIDQTLSQTGWSGQNQQSSTAYSSSQTALHAYQNPPLSLNTTYCWQAQAIDPGGSNTWGNLSATQLFTTTPLVAPLDKTVTGNTTIRGGVTIGQ